MFQDRRSVKIKTLLFPFLLWTAAGAAGEMLSVFFLMLTGRCRDFMQGLEFVHEEAGTYLVLFRAVISIPFFVRFMRQDSSRIREEMRCISGMLPERKVFFFEKRRFSAHELLAVPAGVFFMLFMNLLFHVMNVTGVEVFAGGALHLYDPAERICVLLLECLAAPVCEELLCRGLIYRRIRTYMRLTAAMLVSALFFSLLHWNLSQAVYAFFLGFVLADLYESSRSLLCTCAAHAAANAAAVFLGESAVVRTALTARPGLYAAASGILFAVCFILFVYCSVRNLPEDLREVS